MILDYLDKLVRATVLDEVWEMHCETMAEHGFDRCIYGATRFVTESSLGDFDDATFLTNHDPRYFEKYIGQKLFTKSPLIHWARHNVGACSWGDLWNDLDHLTDEEREIVAFNREMNVTAGYSISFADPSPRSFGMIALAARADLTQSDVDGLWAKHGRVIEAMNHMLHLKVLSLPHSTARARLTDRQREVLEWIGEGKSHLDIATILGVAVPTVEKHARLAREKLGVESTAQAILKASFQNRIYIK